MKEILKRSWIGFGCFMIIHGHCTDLSLHDESYPLREPSRFPERKPERDGADRVHSEIEFLCFELVTTWALPTLHKTNIHVHSAFRTNIQIRCVYNYETIRVIA